MKMFDIAERIEAVMWRREEDVPEPRLVLRGLLSHDGRADRDVHAAVRHRAHHRLGGARDRAARGRQDHPPVRQLHRAGRTGSSCRSSSEPERRHVRSRSSNPLSVPSPTRCSSTSPITSTNYTITSDEAYETARYCLIDTLGCGFEALEVSGVHEAARARSCPARSCRTARKVPGTSYQLDPGAGGVQHRRDDPLARLQRHLARRRMGSSVGQSRRHPRCRPTGCRATRVAAGQARR